MYVYMRHRGCACMCTPIPHSLVLSRDSAATLCQMLSASLIQVSNIKTHTAATSKAQLRMGGEPEKKHPSQAGSNGGLAPAQAMLTAMAPERKRTNPVSQVTPAPGMAGAPNLALIEGLMTHSQATMTTGEVRKGGVEREREREGERK